MVAVVAVLVLVAAGALVVVVRGQASRLVEQAEARHTEGNCQAAVERLGELGPTHRLVARDVVGASEQGRRACEVLLEATDDSGDPDPDGLDAYLGQPGARWAHAGVVRAELLLKASDRDAAWDAPGRDPEAAVEQLVETLAAHPEESASVRDVMSTYVRRFDKDWYTEPTEDLGVDEELPASDACAARAEYLWLHGGGWTEPEIAEPVASTDVQGDDLLAGCAVVRQAAGKLDAARSLYDEYLETYADAPDARSVRTVRDDLVESIPHQRMRDRAVATADRPADGSDVDACRDARCQVRVTSGTLITIGGPGGPYELLVSVDGQTVSARLGGYIQWFSSTGGYVSAGDGYASWGSEPPGELVLNDEVGIGVDGVSGNRATLSVWLVG